MFGNIHTIKSISPTKLDQYLDSGWFRMGQSVFTCAFLNFDRKFYSAIWLRIALEKYQKDAGFYRLYKLNARFRVETGPATICPQKEKLYSIYKTGISFETANSLAELLLKNHEENIFNTYEVCIYDQNRLIAAGFFDLGDQSAAGIVSFYDPEYKKYSLGKYIIYTKINFCKDQGFKYFYPGYFAPNYPVFDYKLSIGKEQLEFLNLQNNAWQSYSILEEKHILINQSVFCLDYIEKLFFLNRIEYMRFKYEYYNSNNMIYLEKMALFDYPEFLFIRSELYPDFAPILVYNAVRQVYILMKCISTYSDEKYLSTDGYYGSHLMKVERELFVSADANQFVALFLEKSD